MGTTQDEDAGQNSSSRETSARSEMPGFLNAPAYSLESSAVLAAAGVAHTEQGLTDAEVQSRLTQYGTNQLTEAPPVPTWKKLVEQFSDLVIWILIVAAVVAGFLGEWIDSGAILAIVILNGFIGFFQERRAEQAMSALRKMSAPTAKVIRNGHLQSVPSQSLVPGDLIQLDAGDHISADARLVQTFGMHVQEAALTGESLPVEKVADVVLAADTSLGDRRNMVYMGTTSTAGKALALVTATGMQTELGHIAGLLARYEPETTPLQKQLAELGRVLIWICLVIVSLIFGLQLWRGGEFIESLLVSVSLAVAAVPEGLPAVVTIALALGLQRMAKRNALVRKLPSVETLGSVSVICSDKTGTLTRNEMTVQEIVLLNERYRVTGIGYATTGEFQVDDKSINVAEASDLQFTLKVGAWCNDAEVLSRSHGADRDQVVGDPTEGALVIVAMKGGLDPSTRRASIVHELPFDSTRKMMSVVVQEKNSKVLYAKGAPEILLARCDRIHHDGQVEPLSDAHRQRILEANSQLASQAMRVLALAYRPALTQYDDSQVESQLVFLALVGMIDPPREEAKVAIARCRAAGIQPVMITGDHQETARAVGKQLGLISEHERSMTGAELEQMSDEQLKQEVESIAIYARATAEHKLRIVRAWKSRGHVVAMTGDGVNDAPAVKAADIGIAMGITGTDVTKEASDMILTDDNFASIVSAVEEGRGIYNNIQKVLLFLLSCNFGEIVLMLLASIIGWPGPLLPIHLLWINLVTDGLPALALTVDPPEPDVMNRPPRSSGESILSWHIGNVIILQGFLDGVVGILAFAYCMWQDPNDLARARTVTFCVVVYSELFRSLSARSPKLTLWQLGIWTNPLLLLAIVCSGLLQLTVVLLPITQPIFGIAPLSLSEGVRVLLLALTPVTLIELTKLIMQQFQPKPETPRES